MDNLFKLPAPLEIWVPIKNTEFTFSLKESSQLPKLQRFLLTAISDYSADADMIIDATRLTKTVIIQELNEMYKEKLLESDDNGNYQLTDLSRRLLSYIRLTEKMNETNAVFSFNLVTGNIQTGIDTELNDNPDGVTANRTVSVFEIDCFEPAEIKDVLIEAFPFLAEDGGSDEEIDDFLENIVITSSHEKVNKWKKMYITHLPLAVSPAQKQELNVRCYVVKKMYRAYDSFFEDKQSLLSEIKDIYEYDPLLLREKGVELLTRWDEYTRIKNNVICLYGNPIDGSVCGSFVQPEDHSRGIAFDISLFSAVSADNCAFADALSGCDSAGFELREIGSENIPYVSSIPVQCLADKIEEGE